jgi:hypothetical protein
VKYPTKQLDENRYINVDHDEWYGPVYTHFTEKMESIGVYVERIYFSISYSQGDGACFEGRVTDWGKYLESIGYTDPILIQEASQLWGMEWKSTGRYCHKHTLRFDGEIYKGENPYDEENDSLRAAVWDALMDRTDLLKLSTEAEDNIRDHCTDLYKMLLEEYEYQTSDEAVADTLEANEIEPLTEEE